MINIARPRKYNTADDLDRAIKDYFSKCLADNKAPKWCDMLNSLNISQDLIQDYQSKTEIYPGFSEVIKRAVNEHSSFWQQYALDHPNSQTFCIFMLKQPYNGGLSDKQEINQDVKIQLQINGQSPDLLG